MARRRTESVRARSMCPANWCAEFESWNDERAALIEMTAKLATIMIAATTMTTCRIVNPD